tara:strand:+ start:37 stop:1179 length:1143 start_codon:yes stop_codon:yes gene_type:complete
MEEIVQTENGSVTLTNTGTPSASYTISRNGDLVHKMYLQMDIDSLASAGSSTLGSIFHNLINEIECEIGGQKIDKHYGHWLETWTSLTVPNDRGTRPAAAAAGATDSGLAIGDTFDNAGSGIGGGGMNFSLYDKMTANLDTVDGNIADTDVDYKKIHIPLQFWFNRNPGLALPLIALQYHEVKIKVLFNSLNTAFGGTTGNEGVSEVKLYTQYIYLDTDERRRFAQVSHEYLIEQLQYQKEGDSPKSVTLNFNHPVKELIWVSLTGSTPDAALLNTTWQLKLNGHDRFSARPLQYFTKQQVYDYHTGYGGLGSRKDTIAVYSFALKPEEHQPSGTCNFSRIDTAQLNDTAGVHDKDLHVYAVNYNVLRIMSGMGGLAYSN